MAASQRRHADASPTPPSRNSAGYGGAGDPTWHADGHQLHHHGNSAGDGGGIENTGALTVTNSTIADNSASSDGGGLAAFAGTTILNNTIVALNTNYGEASPDDIAGTVSSTSAYNLIGTGGSGGLVNGVNGNQVGVADPGLDPNGLQNNGGPTQTIALAAGSPAIDAGSNALAVDPTTGSLCTTDQRAPVSRGSSTARSTSVPTKSKVTSRVAVGWGTQTAALQTAADGLRCSRLAGTPTCPGWASTRCRSPSARPRRWPPATSRSIGASGINYGPVTVSGSGTSYTITLAQPINAADRVTITIGNDHRHLHPPARRPAGRLQRRRGGQRPGHGGVRNEMLGIMGAVPTIFGDINGDGKVDINDYTAVRSGSARPYRGSPERTGPHGSPSQPSPRAWTSGRLWLQWAS